MYRLTREINGKTEVLKDSIDLRDKVFTTLNKAENTAEKLNSIIPKDEYKWKVEKYYSITPVPT